LALIVRLLSGRFPIWLVMGLRIERVNESLFFFVIGIRIAQYAIGQKDGKRSDSPSKTGDN